MHDLVHDESGARHVAGIFHKRNEGIQYQYVGQEYDNASHASYNAIDQ